VTIEQFDGDFARHLPAIQSDLLAGTYRPQPVRALEMRKESGGTRTLGIPTVRDRLVLQALAQILTPLWEPHFSPCSFAYRPERSAQDAVAVAQDHLRAGRRWVVDLDIEGFFDHVDHVRLMLRLAQRVTDVRVLDLIADFLRCGMMRGSSPGGRASLPRRPDLPAREHSDADKTTHSETATFIQSKIEASRQRRPTGLNECAGFFEPTRLGIAQGSPFSPLLANIVLDELDQEYTRLGWPFVRYADDCILLASSEAEARAMLDFTAGFLEDRLHLRLHPRKTRIVPPEHTEFLGFTYRITRYGQVRRRVTRQALQHFRQRIEQLARPEAGRSLKQIATQVGVFVRGWSAYFGFAQDNVLKAVRGFARARLRACAWELWRTPAERRRQLLLRGVPEAQAEAAAYALTLPDQYAELPVLARAFPNSWFNPFGLGDQPPKPARQKTKASANPLPAYFTNGGCERDLAEIAAAIGPGIGEHPQPAGLRIKCPDRDILSVNDSSPTPAPSGNSKEKSAAALERLRAHIRQITPRNA
jgi:RNA-directed DNA polymerase